VDRGVSWESAHARLKAHEKHLLEQHNLLEHEAGADESAAEADAEDAEADADTEADTDTDDADAEAAEALGRGARKGSRTRPQDKWKEQGGFFVSRKTQFGRLNHILALPQQTREVAVKDEDEDEGGGGGGFVGDDFGAKFVVVRPNTGAAGSVMGWRDLQAKYQHVPADSEGGLAGAEAAWRKT
jgi:hypothetical protein